MLNVKSAQKNVANGMGALSSTGSSFGSAAASTRLDQHPTNGSQAAFIDDVLKQQALAEEEAVLNQYKVNFYIECVILCFCFKGSNVKYVT